MINDLSRPCTSTSGSSSAPENGPDHGVVKQKTCENTLSDGPAHFATTPPAAPMPAVTDADPDEPGRRGPLEWFRSARGPMRTVMRPAAIVAALAMIAGLWSLPEGIGFDATVTLAVFAIAVWLWSFTKIGDTYIALGAAVTLVLIGVIDADDAFEALGEDTTWLLIGAFVISGAVAASGLGVRAVVHLAAGCRTPRGLVHLLTLAVVATAFAIPATSGRAALVLPVFIALAAALGPQRRWLVVVLSLALPTVILLSAVGSYIGAGAHLITDQILDRADLGTIGYTGWLMVGMPLALASSHLAAEIVLVAGSTREQRRQRLDLSLADLAAGAVDPVEDMPVHNEAAAHAGAQGHHDHVLKAFAAALPGLTQSGHVGVVACLYRQTRALTQLFMDIEPAPAQIHAAVDHALGGDGAGDTDADAQHVLFVDAVGVQPFETGFGDVIQDAAAAVPGVRGNFPLVAGITLPVEERHFDGGAA